MMRQEGLPARMAEREARAIIEERESEETAPEWDEAGNPEGDLGAWGVELDTPKARVMPDCTPCLIPKARFPKGKGVVCETGSGQRVRIIEPVNVRKGEKNGSLSPVLEEKKEEKAVRGTKSWGGLVPRGRAIKRRVVHAVRRVVSKGCGSAECGLKEVTVVEDKVELDNGEVKVEVGHAPDVLEKGGVNSEELSLVKGSEYQWLKQYNGPDGWFCMNKYAIMSAEEGLSDAEARRRLLPYKLEVARQMRERTGSAWRTRGYHTVPPVRCGRVVAQELPDIGHSVMSGADEDSRMESVARERADLIFNGSAGDAWSALEDEGCCSLEGLSRWDQEMRSLKWSWVTNLTEVAGRKVNEREMTAAEKSAINLFRKGADADKVKQVPVPGFSGAGGPGSAARPEVKRERRREDGLTARAKAVAEEMRGNPERIRGFLAQAHLNRKWASVVCRFLRKGQLGKEVEEAGVSEKAKNRLRKCTSLLVGAWACKEVGPIVEREAPARSEGMETDVDSGNQVDYVRCVVQSMCLTGIAARLNQSKVCPHCLLSGTDAEVPRNEGRFAGFGMEQLRSLDLGALLKKDAEGWLAACAAIHNREQHASNGNIEFSVLAPTDRPAIADAAIAVAYGVNVCRTGIARDMASVTEDLASRITGLPYVPESNRQSRLPDVSGTGHQFMASVDACERIKQRAREIYEAGKKVLEEEGARAQHMVREDASASEKQQGELLLEEIDRRWACLEGKFAGVSAGIEIPVVGTISVMDLKEGLGSALRELGLGTDISGVRYIGVGTTPNYEHGKLMLTKTGIERLQASRESCSQT